MKQIMSHGIARRLLLLGSALIGLSTGGCQPRPVAPPSVPTTTPPLLVTIVVDQLGAWLADDRLPALDPSGGFARLRREGTYVRELRYQHAVMDTAPGHAALYTGATPRDSGIVSNEVVGTKPGSTISILADPDSALVGLDAILGKRAGSSLARLKVETVAEAFQKATPNAQVFSFSLKDRGALFGGGRHPDAVLWLDTESQQFVSSTAFPTPPAWLNPVGNGAAVASQVAAGWSLTDEQKAWVAAHATTPDDQAGEGNYGGLGTTFPHTIKSAKVLRATPGGDRLVVALGKAAVTVAAANHRPTLLALSLSSHDYVAHVFGPDSWEAWDEIRQVDRMLVDLFALLDRSVGPNGYAVMLSADHGSSPLPELVGTPADPWCKGGPGAADRWQRPCGARRRLIADKVAHTLEEALSTAMGPGPWLSGIAEPLLFLNDRARALPPAEQQKLIGIITETARPLGIGQVIDLRKDLGPCAAPDSSPMALVCAATYPGQPGDLYLLAQPGVFFDPNYTAGFGASHGSPYLYDRAVPLLVRAPGRVAAGAVIDAPLPFATFTRTAASLLGVRPPATARPGSDLTAGAPISENR